MASSSCLTGPRFFAGEVSAGKPLKVKLDGKELNITHCALATKSDTNDAYKMTKLFVATKALSDETKDDNGCKKFVLCSLRDGQSCKIDATFFPGDEVVKFLASGPNTLHLTGVISPHEISIETVEEDGIESIDGDVDGSNYESILENPRLGSDDDNNENYQQYESNDNDNNNSNINASSNNGDEEEEEDDDDEEEEEEEEEEGEDDSYDDDEDEDEAIKSKKTNDGSKNSGSIKDPHNSNRRVFFSEDDSRDSSSEVVSPTIGPVLQTFQNSKARDAKQVSFNKWRNVSGNIGNSNNNNNSSSNNITGTIYEEMVSNLSQSQKRKRSSSGGVDNERNNKISGKRSATPNKKSKTSDNNNDNKSSSSTTTTTSSASSTINSNKINEWQTGEHGLRYKDLKIGEGDPAVLGKKLRVAYEGKLTNTGQIFEKNNRGFEFPLGKGKVLRGWDLGIIGMRLGGRRIIRLPPNLAYGSKGYEPFIPKDAPLEFTIEVLKIKS